jgi:hypothetical protein
MKIKDIFSSKEVIDKGEKVKVTFNDPIIQEAFDSCKLAMHSVWAESTNWETREELWNQLQGLERVKTWFSVAIEQGDVEKQMQEEYKD